MLISRETELKWLNTRVIRARFNFLKCLPCQVLCGMWVLHTLWNPPVGLFASRRVQCEGRRNRHDWRVRASLFHSFNFILSFHLS